jgi:hypothetical protein
MFRLSSKRSEPTNIEFPKRQHLHGQRFFCYTGRSASLDQYFYDFYVLLADGRPQPSASSTKITWLVNAENHKELRFFPQSAPHSHTENFENI